MVSFSSPSPNTDAKTLPFSDHELLPSPRRKVVSPFGLGILLSFIVLSAVLINISSEGSYFIPLYQGLRSFGSNNNTSFFSWPFSGGFNSSGNNDNSSGLNDTLPVESLQPHVNETLEANVMGSNKSLDFVDSDGKGKVLENAYVRNESDDLQNGSGYIKNLILGDGSPKGTDLETAQMGVALVSENVSFSQGLSDSENSTVSNKSSDFVDSGGKEKVFENAHVGNESENLQNGSNYVKNATLVDGSENSTVSVGNYSYYLDNGNLRHNKAEGPSANNRSFKDCDIFNGRWVRDDTKPFYPTGSCPYIDPDFNCQLNGRPDHQYEKWRWQPYDCDIPRLNTTDFLERLRDKRLAFVGDSLNRNMWESLVCLLRHGVKNKSRVYEISGKYMFKKRGIFAFRFEDYNCSVDFVNSNFFVKESSFNRKNVTFETLRLDMMDATTSMYRDADVIIFNTGHWWTHEKTSRGEDYYQEGNFLHPKLKVLEAYRRALITWALWVDKNIDRNKTEVFFRGYSLTHFRGGPWSAGGQCHKETEPIYNDTHLAHYPTKMEVLEYVLTGMKTPVTFMNISRLTDYRKDGHPSIYRPKEAGKKDMQAQDCSHWCLPGVTDTWNELLYVSLLKRGRGSWAA